jgi:hypothetical protein
MFYFFVTLLLCVWMMWTAFSSFSCVPDIFKEIHISSLPVNQTWSISYKSVIVVLKFDLGHGTFNLNLYLI